MRLKNRNRMMILIIAALAVVLAQIIALIPKFISGKQR